jgi:hypothetical protein
MPPGIFGFKILNEIVQGHRQEGDNLPTPFKSQFGDHLVRTLDQLRQQNSWAVERKSFKKSQGIADLSADPCHISIKQVTMSRNTNDDGNCIRSRKLSHLYSSSRNNLSRT